MFTFNSKEKKSNKKIKKVEIKKQKQERKKQKLEYKKEKINQKKQEKIRKKEERKIYKSSSKYIQKKNLLFYYIVSFLFFTEVKGMSASDVLFYESFYPFFKLIIEPLIVTLVDSKNKKTCLILGNLSLFIAVLLVLFLPSPVYLIPCNLFMAIGFAIKDQVESTIAYKFINEENIEKKRSLFLKIDGKATSKYHILSAISSVVSSLLYVINPYVPFILSASMLFIATIICFLFEIKEEHEKISVFKNYKNYFVELKDSFKFINNSNRLTFLIIFHGLFHGIFSTMVSFKSSLLTDINISTTLRGILFAIFSLIAFNFSQKANYINKKLKNRTLTIFSKIYFLLILCIGLTAYPENLSFMQLFLIFTLMSSQYIIEGPYRTIINQYLSNFTNDTISSKIFSISGFIAQLFSLSFMLLSSLLLKYFSTALCLVYIGGFAFILFTILLELMKKKVGLRPYEYDESEIFTK